MRALLMIATLFLLMPSAAGSVQEFTDRSAWINAVGDYTTIGFSDLPDNALVTNQYASVGALFTDGIDLVFYNDGFLNDGAGLNGAFDEITVEFNESVSFLACDYPGGLKIKLFHNGQPVYESSDFLGTLQSNFAGLLSDQPFDKVLIVDPEGGTFIDDLHFGPPVPSPCAAALFMLAAVHGRRLRSR